MPLLTMDRLTGDALIEHVNRLSNETKTKQCIDAGYFYQRGDQYVPAFTAFYEALIDAKGMNLVKPAEPQVIYESCPNYSPALYVSCLASYNEGDLWGRWIDLQEVEDEEELKDAINRVLKLSPHPNAEEYAIHDYALCPNHWGEWPDFTEVMTYVEAWVDITDDDAYLAWCNYHAKTFTLDQYNECMVWQGSGRDYAEEMAEEQGLMTVDNYLTNYVDWERVWHGEYECDGYNELHVGGYTYIFDDNNW